MICHAFIGSTINLSKKKKKKTINLSNVKYSIYNKILEYLPPQPPHYPSLKYMIYSSILYYNSDNTFPTPHYSSLKINMIYS